VMPPEPEFLSQWALGWLSCILPAEPQNPTNKWVLSNSNLALALMQSAVSNFTCLNFRGISIYRQLFNITHFRKIFLIWPTFTTRKTDKYLT